MNITKFFRAAIAISALCIGFANTAQADIVHTTGDTTGGPTLDLTQFGFPGAAIPYQAFTFEVDTAGEYTWQVTATFDSVFLLYENSFDPSDTAYNLIDGNDDDVSATTSAFAQTLSVGTTYVFVVTGFDDNEYGSYHMLIGGPGGFTVSAVPEPAAWLMLALGMAGVGAFARYRKAQQ